MVILTDDFLQLRLTQTCKLNACYLVTEIQVRKRRNRPPAPQPSVNGNLSEIFGSVRIMKMNIQKLVQKVTGG